MKGFLAMAVAYIALVGVVIGFVAGDSATPVVKGPTQTIYIRDLAPQFESPKAIERAIPGWERAANGDFSRVWHTPRVNLVYLGNRPAPAGSVEADFVASGPVKGALAYHTQLNGEPRIVVYAGTGDYYGYSNGVSFTHELFELLADEHTASINQGWPFPYITFDHGQFGLPAILATPTGQLLINEVADPVEAYHYVVDGAWISDWVTPNYFNDEQTMPPGVPEYDHMGLVQQPLTLLRGGYQSLFVIGYPDPLTGIPYTGWVSVTNFRHAGKDPGGFMDDNDAKVVLNR